MKRGFLALLIVAVLACGAHAEVFRRVVMYQDMAYLTVELSSSGGTLKVDCPPETILDSVAATPARGVGIKSMSIEPKRLTSGRAKQLREALAQKKADLEAKKRYQKTIERQIELIFNAAGVKDREAPFSRTHLTDALQFIDERVEGLDRKHIGLGREIEGLSLQVRDLEEQLDTVSRRPGYEIRVETDKDGTVRVSYAVKNSSWRPEYTVYADPARGEMRIHATAVIRQATGVDWDAQELLVATGRPGFGIQAPELSPWYVGLPRFRGDVQERTALKLSAAPEEAETDQNFEAGVKATAASYFLGSASSVSLPGDGTPKSVILQKKQVKAAVERITCPRIDSGVFLRMETLWNGGAPILAGSYSAYVDGEFMGKGVIRQTRPGEKITVDLGRDEGVAVERKERIFHEKTLTGRDKTTYSYTMTIRNTRGYPVQVTLKDQMPVSQDEAVKTELVESSPRVPPDKDGILVWRLDCAPGAQETISFAFSIAGMPPL